MQTTRVRTRTDDEIDQKSESQYHSRVRRDAGVTREPEISKINTHMFARSRHEI